MGENLTSYTAIEAPFPLQVSDVLVALNVNRALDLLDALERTQPVLVPVITQLRAPLPDNGSEAADRLRALQKAYLLLDGLPFINRSRLREILAELLDAANPARVGVVAGAELAGKSWSLHLIRAYCNDMQDPKVHLILIDLERLQPGNDPAPKPEES